MKPFRVKPKIVIASPREDFVHLHTHSEYCIGPNARVAMADLQWVQARELKPGYQVVGFDEDLRGSKMKVATVQAVKRVVRPCYEITTADGRKIIASDLHGWVTIGTTRGAQTGLDGLRDNPSPHTRQWLRTCELMEGTKARKGRARSRARLVQWCKPWFGPSGFWREGWLAGIADGEGSLHNGQLSLAQNEGPVLDEIVHACNVLGYPITEPRRQGSTSCFEFRFAGYGSALRFIGECAPIRFKSRSQEIWVGRKAGGRYQPPVDLVSVEYVGERETVAVQTDTRTLVVEGFLSHNSVLDGMNRIARGKLSIRGFETKGKTMVGKAAELGAPALALTDHGTLGGYFRFIDECRLYGVKPIIGVEFYMCERDMRERDKERRYKLDHLVVLARNWEGLKKLIEMTTLSNVEGFYQKPRLDERTLLEFAGSDLIVLSGCIASKLARLNLDGRDIQARKWCDRLANAFEGQLWMELQPHIFPAQIDHNKAIVDLASSLSIPIVSTNDAHYLNQSDADDHNTLLAIQTGGWLGKPDGFQFTGNGFHLATRGEMIQAFREQGVIAPDVVRRSLDETLRVADLIDLQMPKLKGLVPAAELPAEHVDKRAWIEALCAEGWVRVGIGYTCLEGAGEEYAEVLEVEYRDRLKYELDTIDDLGFLDYFLVAAELYADLRDLGIFCGPGRGSAAGCLVSYLLGIIKVDPIRFGLQFERFLNPSRGNPPDIDMDFPHDKREVVIDWFRRKFGAENVAIIGTWGTLQGKSALKKTASAHSVPPPIAERAADLVPDSTGGTGSIDDVDRETLRWFEMRFPGVVDTASRLEGLVQTRGAHASGIIASPRLREVMPLEMRKGTITTALTGKECEKQGLLKWDVLAVKKLTAFAITIAEVERSHGEVIDEMDIDLSDPEALALIQSGRTAGVFQFDSHTAARECHSMTFETFDDVRTMSALLRPGTLRSGTSEIYYQRRRGDEEVPSVHPAFDNVTRDTYGVIVFEEQVSALFHQLAGWSLAEADKARVVVAKSQGSDKFELLREGFVNGAVDHGGMPADEATELFDQLVSFSGYAFNKAHATAYSMMTVWSAWFRVHYPPEFWAGWLSVQDDRPKAAEYAHAARVDGVVFALPSVNESGWRYRVERQGKAVVVRTGFQHVLGVGEAAAEMIEDLAPYKSPEDFLHRIDRRICNAKTFKALILAGAFSEMEPNTRDLFERADALIKKAKKGSGVVSLAGGKTGFQRSLLDTMPGVREAAELKAWDDRQAELRRLSVLPLPISRHPVLLYEDAFAEMGDHIAFRDLIEMTERAETAAEDETVRGRNYVQAEYVWIRGFVTATKSKKGGNRGAMIGGSTFMDVALQDQTATAKLRFFRDAFTTNHELLQDSTGQVVVVMAKAFWSGGLYFAERIARLDSFEAKMSNGRTLSDFESWLVEPPVEAIEIKGKEYVPIDELRTPTYSGRGHRRRRMPTKRVCGVVVRIRPTRNRRGDPMAWVLLMGAGGCREIAMWPDVWARYRKTFNLGDVVALRCRFSPRSPHITLDQDRSDWIRRVKI